MGGSRPPSTGGSVVLTEHHFPRTCQPIQTLAGRLSSLIRPRIGNFEQVFERICLPRSQLLPLGQRQVRQEKKMPF